jgi:Tfp pilus assembly protein PilV
MSTSKRRPRVALGLIEVIFSLFLFMMMALMFAAVIPVATRSSKYSSSYAMAAQIAQHKIDQIRDAGYAKCNGTALKTLNLIDSATAIETSGTAETFAFTTTDSLLAYFPAGATGTVTTDNYAPSSTGTGFNIRQVTITITWRDAGGPTSSFSTTALIAVGGD